MFNEKELNKALIDNGLEQKDLAIGYGCSEPHMSLVIRGKKKSKPIEDFISKRLNIKPIDNLP